MRYKNRYVIENPYGGRKAHLMDDGRIVWEQDMHKLAEITQRKKAAGGGKLNGSHAVHLGDIPTNEYYRLRLECGDDEELFEQRLFEWFRNREHRKFLVRDKV